MSKERVKKEYGYTDFWWYYYKTHPDPISKQRFAKIFKLFFKKVVQRLYESNYIAFPYNLGEFFIKSYKPSIIKENENYQHKGYKNTDYKATKELWEQHPELKHKTYLNYTNEHTGGLKVKVVRLNTFKNRLSKVFNFHPCRSFSRGQAKYIKNNPNTEYYEC